MKNSILSLGKVLNKEMQQEINGGTMRMGCVSDGNGHGEYRELDDNEIATC